MDTFVIFLVFCQALGAGTGALFAVWSELAYIRAMRDGNLDIAERAHLDVIARGLRFGMTLLLLASLGLVVAAYTLQSAPQPALTLAYWIFIVVAILIISISWALSRGHVSFAIGSATLFTSWWFLAFLTVGWLSPSSFGSTVALLVVAMGVFYALLHYIRILAGNSTQKINP